MLRSVLTGALNRARRAAPRLRAVLEGGRDRCVNALGGCPGLERHVLQVQADRDALEAQLEAASADAEALRGALGKAAEEVAQRGAAERRLEVALTTEQGLRAQAERYALEAKAGVDELREQSHRAVVSLRAEVASLRRENEERCGRQGRLRELIVRRDEAAQRMLAALATYQELSDTLKDAAELLRAAVAVLP